MISNLKLDIVKAIKDVTVDGLEIQKYASKPETFTKLPAITYSSIYDSLDYSFKGIKREKGIFQVDIWAEKNSDISKILIELKKKMFEFGYFYRFGSELNEPSGIKRYVTNFEIKK